MTEETLTPTQDDRIMAALAHIGALLPMMGLVAPIVVWVTQKDKSKFVHFQALQALIFQLTMVLLYFLSMGCYMLSFFGMFFTIPFTESAGSSAEPDPLFFVSFFIPFVVMGVMTLGGLVFIIYGIIAAIMTGQGKDFRYLLVGKWTERFLAGKSEPGSGGEDGE